MAFTAQLGLAASTPGNIVLGLGAAAVTFAPLGQPFGLGPVLAEIFPGPPLWPLSIAGVLYPQTTTPTPPLQRLLGRDPKQDARTRRFMQILQQIFNSFLRRQTLTQAADGSFGMANLLFVGNGAPPESLAYPGCFYLDLDTGILYEKS